MLSEGPRKRGRGLVGAVRIHDTGRVSLVRVDHLSPGVVPESKLVQLLSWRTRGEFMVPGVPRKHGTASIQGHSQVSARPGRRLQDPQGPFVQSLLRSR
ncbi:hypothetical protein NDU88_001989 [Pleurodeles waltl]|uniref:Uncharacterized protein n=1 Tax=Pleurodeles waltl TaxID=8319 RepID=A0AAV7M4Q2_PLEWA|nr:hypothetical protein NDU88_001989 [Pleurodeles waltl]